MTRIEFIIEFMTKLRLWEHGEDTRLRTRDGKIRYKESFNATELHILFTAALADKASVAREDFNLGSIIAIRKDDLTKTLDRLEKMNYLRSQTYPTPNNKTKTRYFITDLGMRFVNTLLK